MNISNCIRVDNKENKGIHRFPLIEIFFSTNLFIELSPNLLNCY